MKEHIFVPLPGIELTQNASGTTLEGPKMLQVPHLFAQVKCEIAYSRIAHYTGCEKTTLCTQNAGKTHESITKMKNKGGGGLRPPPPFIGHKSD